MIVIWRGAGGLVIIFGIISAVLGNVVASAFSNQNDYFARHAWLQAGALWFAGVTSWFAGRYFNTRPGKGVVNRQTGETVIEKPNHHLMFIKMEYWGLIYFAIGLVVLIFGVIRN